MEFRSKKSVCILILAIVVISVTGLLAKKYFFSKAKETFITAVVTKMDIEESVLASGTLQALKTVEVGAQVNGQLKKLHVRLGDQVSKGDLLAEIDPVLQQNSLKDAEASQEYAEAQISAKKALLHQLELSYKRQQELAAKDAVSKADLESAQAQMETSRADLQALLAQLKKAKVAVNTSQANLNYTRILAPMDGVVISIVTEEGQTVVSAQAAPTILKLANIDTITVKAQISEADVTRVKAGQLVYFTILGDPDTRYYSKLRAIEPGPESLSSGASTTITSTSSSSTAIYYNGLFDVPNPGNKLRVSMTAQVSVVLSQAKQALCIPVSSLRNKEKNGYYTVKVLRNAAAENRKIRVGINNNVNAQVLDGLQEGEKVIIGDTPSPSATSEKTSSGPPSGGM